MNTFEYQPGDYLYKLGTKGKLSKNKKVFIHNGYVTGDGYGVLLGFTDDEQLCTSSGWGNYCYGGDVRYATQDEIEEFIKQVQNYDKPIRNY